MREPRLEPLARLPAKLLLLVDRLAAGNREARQDRLAGQRPIGAAQRDLDAGLRRLGQVGEERHHLGAGLEPMLRREPPALGGRDERALGDAEQRVVRLIVGGGRRNRARWSRPAAGRAGRRGRSAPARSALGLEPVALQFDIEPVAEGRGQALQAALGEIGHVRAERAVDRAGRAAGQRDQALAADRARSNGTCGSSPSVGSSQRLGDEPHQGAVAGLVLGEEHDRRAGDALLGEARGGGRRVAEIDRRLARR